ncbi:MAG: ABC transporter substrate-binding protein [Burkholderiales bacterium]|jgi:iron complex transport system substrate-binding protein|nr:ABC transporter substrate-binding protein [Burkholderiales bacterium]
MKNTIIFLLLLSFVLGSAPQSALSGEKNDTRVVIDMAGRTVTLSKEIQRIGTLGAVGVLNTFVEVMGDGSKIINRLPASFANSDRWKLQYTFAPQIAQGPLFENANRELLIENIIITKPDVILTMSKETAEQVEKTGLPCVYLEWKDVNDIKAAVLLMGQILNKQEMAKKYVDYFDEKIALAESLIIDLPKVQRPRVLYGNPLQLAQPHAIAEWWIEKAGGISVTSGGVPVRNNFRYGQEDLLKWNPQIIVLTNGKDLEEIKKHAKFQNIAAIKNNTVYVIPTVAHVWGNRTVEQPLTVLWAIHQFHPRMISREKLAEEIKYFYHTFFLYDFDDTQVAEIIDGKF